MDRLGIVLLLSLCTAHGRRLRRQTLPSQHVQVHSLHSNVLFGKYITVISSESRIDMTEKNVNGSIWSGHSIVTFDSYDTFVNCSAQQAESFLNVQNSASIFAQGNDINFFMRTNRTQGGHSSIVHDLVGNVNVSLEDSGLRVQGVRGQRAGIEAITWVSDQEKSMHIAASTLPNGVRELVLIATSPLYHVRVCFLGATVYVEFGDKIVQIDGDYTSINVFTDKYSIVARTNTTPYDVSLTKEEILVRCPNESTLLRVLPSGVDVNVEQLNKLQIDRGGGELSLGSDVLAADVVKVTALSTDLNLDNSGRVTANTLNSHISVQTAVQNVGMTAAHHVIRVDGGAPHIIVESGRACIEVKASHGLPQLEDLLSPFVTPADQFANIGPEQAAQLTTLPQDFAEPSFPRPGDLGGPLILFNGSDRCAACINQTTVFPTTKLPSSLIPTFPTATSIDYVPHTEASLSTASRTFPTLISLQSDSSTLTTAATSEPTFTTATFPTPSKTLSPSSQPSVTQPGVPDTTVTGTAKPFPSPGDFTTIPEATVSTSKVGTDGQGAGTTATTTISGSTSDQFVIGQFEEFSSDGSSSTSTVTQSVTKPVPEILTSTPGGTMIVTASTSLPSLTTQPIEQGFPEPTSLPGTNPPDTVVTSNQVDEHFPSPTSLPVSEPGLTPVSGGGGGSWETETLFPTPPTTLPRKPSVLVLKMKIPSSLDLQSFDLTSNLTTALNEVVRESVKRVKRFKRSSREQSQEHLVEVHKIERVGNAVQVLFSVNETEVDSYMVEKDLSSLDRSYLMRFVGFPVLSTIRESSLDTYLDFVVLGTLALVLSIACICYTFRNSLKRTAWMVLTKASRQMPRCPLTEKVTNITIITDETLSA